ncbi:putative transcriptional regulator, PadR family [Nocardia nova SH22a]|uniref:Putative transcriptional regulator, PadR family n=1 Tax=Nocardia nova SH22a TaxID=1415166 RepID=W5TQC6_9NOCA|nr:PadR family transcriptional regulator [Nocardia nova]AHH21158.1 putative transcriptional regulator, PadR family [Nocardia nova SH22a]
MSKQPGATLTPLAISVLGLLEEDRMHPYEMYQLLLKRRKDNLLKIRPGSLYHTVTRLAEQGLVQAEGTERSGNRPERTTYRITEAGTAALRHRIAEIVRRPVREYPIFPIGLAESHNLPLDEAITLLTERIGWLDNDITELDVLREWAHNREVPRRYWMVIDYIRGLAEHEATWLRGLIEEMRDGSLPWQEFDAEGTRCPDRDGDLGHDWGAALTDDVLAELRKGGANTADR